MPAYVIAEIQVTDPTAYEEYRPLAAASIARSSGRFIVRGGNIDLLEASRSRSGSLSSSFPMRIRRAAGTAPTNTKPR
jgi:uncharacterized protein (DUF1330 family)